MRPNADLRGSDCRIFLAKLRESCILSASSKIAFVDGRVPAERALASRTELRELYSAAARVGCACAEMR
jgi:hypothetical protein